MLAVDVAISHDGGAHWETVARSVYGTSVPWPTTGPLSTHMRVRVNDAFVPTMFDVTDGDFSLCAAVAVTDSAAGSSDPRAAVSADFNEDGRADLAVATGAGVQVQLTTPAGGLGAATTYGAALVANGITTADFDEDGILDLAVATSTGAAVLRGLGSGAVGDGTFAAPITIALSGAGSGIAAGDLDHDGILDLVVTTPNAAAARVLIGQGTSNTGNGTFVPKVGGFVSLSKAPTDVVLADFNEDGALDIAAVNPDSAFSAVHVALGNLTGGVPDATFASSVGYAAGVSPNHLLARDIDSDGILDLIVTNDSHPGTVTMLKGNGTGVLGDGTFAAPVGFAGVADPRGLVMQDYTMDGNEDLAVVSGQDRSLTLFARQFLQGVTPQAFIAEPALVLGNQRGVPVGRDGGADGMADFLVAGIAPDQVHVLANPCPVAIFETVTLTAPAGGETWDAASTQTITWTPGFGLRRIHLEVSRDGGAIWERIASDLPAGSVFVAGSSSYTWRVTPPASANARLRVVDATIGAIADTSGTFTIGGGLLDAESIAPPGVASLSAAWPNPTAGAVNLVLAMPEPHDVSVAVFDMQGRRVRSLASGAMAAGRHALAWDGRTEAGARAASGLYFVRARWAGFEATRRVVRMR